MVNENNKNTKTFQKHSRILENNGLQIAIIGHINHGKNIFIHFCDFSLFFLYENQLFRKNREKQKKQVQIQKTEKYTNKTYAPGVPFLTLLFEIC